MSALTWEREVSASRLVGDPVVDDGQMLLESLSQGAVGLGHKLLLALGAGDEVDQVAGLAVHTTVDLHRLPRHRGLAGVQRVDVLTHVTVGLLALDKPGGTVRHLQQQQQSHNSLTQLRPHTTFLTTITPQSSHHHPHITIRPFMYDHTDYQRLD